MLRSQLERDVCLRCYPRCLVDVLLDRLQGVQGAVLHHIDHLKQLVPRVVVMRINNRIANPRGQNNRVILCEILVT